MTATPYAPAALLVADRPFPPPRSPLEFSGPRQAARRWASAPHAPAPSAPRSRPQARHAHTRQTRRPALKRILRIQAPLKRKEKMGRRRPAGETPRLCKPQRGAAIAEAVPKHNSKTRSGPGGLGGSLPDRRCTGLGTRRCGGGRGRGRRRRSQSPGRIGRGRSGRRSTPASLTTRKGPSPAVPFVVPVRASLL